MSRAVEEDSILPAANVEFTPPPPVLDDPVNYSRFYTCNRCDVKGKVAPGKEAKCWLCGQRDRLVGL